MLTMTRPSLLLCLLALLGPVLVGGAAAAPPGHGPVRISGASPYAAGCFDNERAGLGAGFADAETEIALAADPSRPRRLIAAWMQDLYAGYVTAASHDGGASWTTSIVPGISRCAGGQPEMGVDPALAVGVDGTAYLAGFSLDLPDDAVPAPVRSRLQVSTSADSGLTWSPLHVIADDAGTLHDKPAITPDPRRAGTAHLVWTQESTAFGPLSTGIWLTTTRDGGKTWTVPRTVLAPNPPTLIPHGSELLVLPDGSLLVLATMLPGLLPDTGRWLPHTIQAVRSSDGGSTWTAPATVAEFDTGDASFHSGADTDGGERIQAPSAFTGADVAPDGTVHVAWRHAVDARTVEVRTSRSSDGGRTWAPPRVVRAGDAEVFLPHLAVAGDGTVGVTYHDTRADVPGDAGFTTDLWLSRSRDGGRTWTEEHLVGPVDLRTAPRRDVPSRGLFLGDYHGLIGTAGGFTAAVALPAPFARAGATDVFLVRRSSQATPPDSGRR